MSKIRIGVIGLGGMSGSHVEKMNAINKFTIQAVCDNDQEKVNEWVQKHQLDSNCGFTDFEQLIACEKVDAIIAATPNDIHYKIMDACLRAGKPLMAEKPFTRTYTEAKKLYEYAKEHDADCFVGFSYRYVPSFRMARKWVQDGKIGTVRHMSVQYLQEWGVPLHGTPMNWRWDRSVTGTGVVHDLASHMIDAARFLVGEPTEVQGMMCNLIADRKTVQGEDVQVDIDDFAAFTALIDHEVPAIFQTSRNAYGHGNDLRVSLFGDLGTLHVSYDRGEWMTWIHPDQGTASHSELQVPDEFRMQQLDHFASYVNGQMDSSTPRLVDGYRNQLILEAIETSSKQKRAIRIEDIEQQGGAGQ